MKCSCYMASFLEVHDLVGEFSRGNSGRTSTCDKPPPRYKDLPVYGVAIMHLPRMMEQLPRMVDIALGMMAVPSRSFAPSSVPSVVAHQTKTCRIIIMIGLMFG